MPTAENETTHWPVSPRQNKPQVATVSHQHTSWHQGAVSIQLPAAALSPPQIQDTALAQTCRARRRRAARSHALPGPGVPKLISQTPKDLDPRRAEKGNAVKQETEPRLHTSLSCQIVRQPAAQPQHAPTPLTRDGTRQGPDVALRYQLGSEFCIAHSALPLCVISLVVQERRQNGKHYPTIVCSGLEREHGSASGEGLRLMSHGENAISMSPRQWPLG